MSAGLSNVLCVHCLYANFCCLCVCVCERVSCVCASLFYAAIEIFRRIKLIIIGRLFPYRATLARYSDCQASKR